ncbi:MAG: MFS transporter [Deltaproteobacteria bacterium]|nr:MFS transporter [Deltaproteobacteria bacterium]
MHPLIYIAFIFSGFSSLTLETIWIRYLEHIFGATTLAVSTVLTCFMGGLALGSFIFGKYADKFKSPVLAYGIAEGVVGIFAFIIPVVITYFYPALNTYLTNHLSNNFLLFSFARFAAVAFLLIIPTTCMGATLPLLARHVVSRKSHMNNVGQRIGILYTLNTTGAIAGVFFTAFVLLKTIGLWATNATAGIINLSLFLAIVVFRKKLTKESFNLRSKDFKEGTDDSDLVILNAPVAAVKTTSFEKWLVIIAFFLSGLASMNLQVVWNRVMAMVIGSSVYSFAIVLLAFLFGLVIGSAIFSKLSRRIARPVFVLGLVELAIAGFAVLSYIYIDDLPWIFARLVTSNVENYEDHVGIIQFIMFLVASFPVIPVTIGMGATFPLTIKAISSSFKDVGKDVGNVYAFNTLGAIAGSFLSAFVFVPLFSKYSGGAGMETTYFLSISIYALSGIVLLTALKSVKLKIKLIPIVSAVLISLLFIFNVTRWDPAKLTIGVFRLSLMEDALDEESWGEPDIKYYHDGVTTTVSIEMWGRHIALKNNGKVDASNGDDMPTQIMAASYPLMFSKKDFKEMNVAIVGFGSGVTVGAALQFPVKHIDCTELERAVIEASNVFGTMEYVEKNPEFNVNHLVYRDHLSTEFDWMNPDSYVINDRLKIFANDGRNFLATAPDTYDVIISEPSNPWITGVSNMFTRESFESSAKALTKGGVFGQWVQLYEMSPENIKTIFRTFVSVYPYASLFSAEDLSSDTILVGSFEPLDFNLKRLQTIFKNSDIQSELNRAYIFSETDFLGRVLLVNRDEILDYTNGPDRDLWKELPINTDDNAYIEFRAPKDLISFKKYAGYLATIYTSDWKYGELQNVLSGFEKGDKKAENLANLAFSLMNNGRKLRADVFINEAKKIAPENRTVIEADRVLSFLLGRLRDNDPQLMDPVFSPSIKDAQKNYLNNILISIKDAIEKKDYHLALVEFLSIPESIWRKGGPSMLHLKGYLHFLNADPSDSTECEDSIEILSQLAGEYESYAMGHPVIYYYLGLCHDNALHFDKAVKNIKRFVKFSLEKERLDEIAQRQERENLEAVIKGIIGTAPLELDASEKNVSSTDGQGENPKGMLESTGDE